MNPAAVRNAAVWSLRALLAAGVFAAFAIAAPRGPQLALALGMGRRVLFERAFDIGWLGGLVEFGARHLAGLGGLAALGGCAVIAMLALVEFRARLRAGDILALAATMIAAFAFLDVLRIAGGGAPWLAAAALLFILERAPGRHVYWAIAITAVWCNLSAQGVVAPLLAGLFALGRTLDDGYDSPEVRRLWLVALGCAFAILLTPAGVGFVSAAPLAARLDRDLMRILPLAPDALVPLGYRTAFFAIVAVCAALGLAQQRSADRLLLAAAVTLTLIDGAYLPLLGIIAAPIVAESVSQVWPKLAAFSAVPGRAAAIFGGVTLLFAVACAIGINLRANEMLAENAAPRGAIEHLAADGWQHRLLCTSLETCDYAIDSRNIGAWMDGRVERYPADAREVQRVVQRAEAGWEKRASEVGIDAILVRRTDTLATLLALSPGWGVDGGDVTTLLYRRVAAK